MPRREATSRLLVLAALTACAALSGPASLAAADCSQERERYKARIESLRADGERPGASDAEKTAISEQIKALTEKAYTAEFNCQDKERERERKETKQKEQLAEDQAKCKEKSKSSGGFYSWSDRHNRCISKADTNNNYFVGDSDECGSATAYAGQLKGENCKKALNAVRDIQSRTGAVSDLTTAGTAAYSTLQAQSSTGSQEDVQNRQANIMKTLALAKFATGALSLTGAMQLKSAASGAEQAKSMITDAQRGLASECQGAEDDQACFYKNAAKYGVPPDQQGYATFDRMRRGAQQSQDQADAANALAKTSMITGAADVLVGLQAMRAAQMAKTNAQQLAPPVPPILPPPPSAVRLGDGSQSVSPPGVESGAPPALTDYGNPEETAGTFGDLNQGPIRGGLMGGGRMGPPNLSRPSSSGVSGGGGGGGGSGSGGTLRGGKGGGQRGSTARRGGTGVAEYSQGAGGTGFKGGGAGGEKGDPTANPMAEMLAKLFPQDPAGKPIVDARQIASSNQPDGMMPEQEDASVTASDLSIFEQVSVKYRQLYDSGRF